MISSVVKLLDPVFEKFDWLDRYGWVTRPVSRTFPLKGKKKSITETFPMSVGVSRKECFEKSLYYLVPDPRFSSLGYWEFTSDYSIGHLPYIPGNQGRTITFPCRLVIWYNAKALGYDANSLNSDIFFTIFTTLDGYIINNPVDYPAISVAYNLNKAVSDKQKIFGQYSYRSAHEHLFQAPNGYIAFDFEITIKTTKECIPQLTVGTDEFCDTTIPVDESSVFPDWSKDSYQRFVSSGESHFEVTDFKIQDISNLSVDQVEQLYIVFLDGRKAGYTDSAPAPDQYSISGKEILIDNNHYLTGTKIEIYKR